jgi:hypothetical protein
MSGSRQAFRLLRRLGFTAGLLAAALPALEAKGAKPEFGPNVLIFDPSVPSEAIQKQIALSNRKHSIPVNAQHPRKVP